MSAATIALMKQRGTYLVPTAYLLSAIPLDRLPPQIRAKAESVIPRARDSHRRAIRAGVKVAFGTDAAVIPHGQNAKEFSTYVEYGMTPLQAIRTATLNAADLLGVNDRGVLAAGKLADVIAVPGNPLDDVKVLEQVSWVMKGGQVVPPVGADPGDGRARRAAAGPHDRPDARAGGRHDRKRPDRGRGRRKRRPGPRWPTSATSPCSPASSTVTST